MSLYLFTIGFVSILGQVVILRELDVAFFGVELVYILAMGVWLLGTGIGAAAGRRHYLPPASLVRVSFLVFAVLLPADVAFVRALRGLLGGIPGTYLPFGLQIAGLACALLPIGALLGLLFQWAAKWYVSGDRRTEPDRPGSSRTLARAYAVESAGGLVGGVAATAFLAADIQNFAIGLLCAASAAGVVRRRMAGNDRDRMGPAAKAIMIVLIAAVILSPAIDRALTRIGHPDLAEARDSPYGRITVTRQGEQVIVFENDALAFETQSASAEELVHLAAMQCDSLSRVLVLGGGLDGVVAEALKYAPQRVDCVELNRVLLALAERNLPDGSLAPLRAEPVRLHIADPRAFVKRPGANGVNEAYDLVLVNAPDPASGQANRFYTREFFGDCARLVSPGGALAFRLAASENVWTRFVTYRNASIYHALGGAFADVILLPAEKNVVIASNRPLVRDPQTLSERFLSRRVATRLVTPAYVTYLYTNDRFFAIAERMQNTLIAPNTDVRPVCYRYSSMIWLSKFYPGMINRDVTGPPPGTVPAVLAVCLAAVGLLLVAGRRPVWRRITVVFTAGFVGMIMETVFILYYQVKHGVLFQNIGVLLTAFMAGLSAGAVVVDRAASRRRISSAWGYGFFAAFAALVVLFRLLLGMPSLSSLWSVSVALFTTGFLVAALFAYASLHGAPEQRGVVSPLYAADLLGGCAGSILGSLFMVPFLGMAATALLVAAASVAALLVAGGAAAPSHQSQSR